MSTVFYRVYRKGRLVFEGEIKLGIERNWGELKTVYVLLRRIWKDKEYQIFVENWR